MTRNYERKTDRLLKTLRQLALKQQKEAPQLFLSLRQAARRFDVSIATMAAVYKQLVGQGILHSVRGSRTILRGRETSRTLQVRGLIGMPLSVPRLHGLRDYRECFLRLRHELNVRGFAIAPFYFEEREIRASLFVERSKKEKLDMVVWLQPNGADRDTTLRLRDLGIRFIGVNIGGVADAFWRYEVQRHQAMLTIVHDWRANLQLDAALIVLTGHETPAEMKRMMRLRRLLASDQIDCQLSNVPEGRIGRFLKSLCADGKKGVLLPGPAAAMLASRAPDTVEEILGTCRVALIEGAVDLPFGQRAPDIAVDLVNVDWRSVGERIARDILSGEAFRRSETTIFEAEAHLQVPLRSTAS